MLHGTPFHGVVSLVCSVLDRAVASYRFINSPRDAEARRRVREIDGGFESAPTLDFPDGSTLNGPALRDLEDKLAALGLQIRPLAWSHRLAQLLEN